MKWHLIHRIDDTARELLKEAVDGEVINKFWCMPRPLELGVLGDYLGDQGHPGEEACRWAIENKKGPIQFNSDFWWWQLSTDDEENMKYMDDKNLLPWQRKGSCHPRGCYKSLPDTWRWLIEHWITEGEEA